MELGAGVEDAEEVVQEEEDVGVDAEGQGEVDEEEAGVARGEEVRREGARPGVEDEEIKDETSKRLATLSPTQDKDLRQSSHRPLPHGKEFLDIQNTPTALLRSPLLPTLTPAQSDLTTKPSARQTDRPRQLLLPSTPKLCRAFRSRACRTTCALCPVGARPAGACRPA